MQQLPRANNPGHFYVVKLNICNVRERGFWYCMYAVSVIVKEFEMATKNIALMDELNSARRRQANQRAMVEEDTKFLEDKKLVAAMPATAQQVRARLKRREAALKITNELVTELEKGTGGIPNV